MSRFLGWVLFFGGIVGLGYWAHEVHAERIESAVRDEVHALNLSKFPDVSLTVSGRDISIDGSVTNAEMRDELLAQLSSLRTARLVNDQLESVKLE